MLERQSRPAQVLRDGALNQHAGAFKRDGSTLNYNYPDKW